MRLLVDVVEIFIQAIFGQQGGVRASAVFFDKLKMQFAVLADLIGCLFANVKQGIILLASAILFDSVLYHSILHHFSLLCESFCRSRVYRQDVSLIFA